VSTTARPQSRAILQVVVWKRIDFRESSRLVTLVCRERGRFTALAKGAHRPTSAHLGKLDFLNRCEVEIAGRGIPLLGRTRLLHEPRALRGPQRFLITMHAVELFDRALIADRSDPELFDLLVGTLTLLERMPPTRLPIAVLGLELRLLAALGVLGDLEACPSCGAAAPTQASVDEAGLSCDAHRGRGAVAVSAEAAAWLRRLARAPGREWPGFAPGRGLGEALAITGAWIERGLELRPRYRVAALAGPAR
jgi:DNA repair protein RecO (recombination protein O)